MTGTAKATVFIDNERVIVTEYRFAPGENTGWHRHGHDYVIVPLMDGKAEAGDQRGRKLRRDEEGRALFPQRRRRARRRSTPMTANTPSSRSS